jgi:hypothetical protein
MLDQGLDVFVSAWKYALYTLVTRNFRAHEDTGLLDCGT